MIAKMLIVISALLLPLLQEEQEEEQPEPQKFETDVYKCPEGELTITFIGHGTLMFAFDDKIVHVDPVGQYADYAALPDADVILVTHEHGDHLDPAAIREISTEETELILTKACFEKIEAGTVMKNGESRTVKGLEIEAVPAYNLVHKRDNGQPFHPPGAGNGYVIAFGSLKVYVAGDTENIPEMKELKGIDVAFLPMNLPYTMTPEMTADAARMIEPKVLYPYHYGKTDPARLVELLAGDENIKVLVRKMQ